MRLTAAIPLLSLLVSIPLAAPAQSTNGSTSAAPSADRPGRDPKQPIDEEYTKKILEYTTEKFFLPHSSITCRRREPSRRRRSC